MSKKETVIITGRAKPRVGLLVAGIILFTLGIVLTGISESFAGPTGTYYVFWGAVLAGFVYIVEFFMLLTDKVKVTNMRVKGSRPFRRFNILLSQINSVVLQDDGSIIINSAAQSITTLPITKAPQVVDEINKLLGVLVQPQIQQPVQPVIQQPVQPVIQQPVQPVMQQPVQPVMQQPVQPAMQQPVQPAMQQPARSLLQPNIPQGVADELKKALDLVNSGAMTIQEYEDYKRRLLSRQ